MTGSCSVLRRATEGKQPHNEHGGELGRDEIELGSFVGGDELTDSCEHGQLLLPDLVVRKLSDSEDDLCPKHL